MSNPNLYLPPLPDLLPSDRFSSAEDEIRYLRAVGEFLRSVAEDDCRLSSSVRIKAIRVLRPIK